MVSRAGAEEHGMLCRAACRKAAVTKATTEVCHCCTELKSAACDAGKSFLSLVWHLHASLLLTHN